MVRLGLGVTPIIAPSPTAGAPDRMAQFAVARVAAFADWCSRNSVNGHIGEMGWPNRSSDGDQWNRAMATVLAYCETRGLGVTHWATGNNRNGYALSAWQPPSLLADVNATTRCAAVWERYLARTTSQLSGAYVSGGHNKTPFSSENPSDSSTGNFSNLRLGTYNTDYAYDSRATFDYLYGRGVRTVTISFRWERLQPTLSAAFNSTEQTRFTTCVNDAIAAGLRVIVQPFNKGEYYVDNGTAGTRNRIGVDAGCTQANFTDLWTRMATLFSGTAGVIGYGLMNEPATGNFTTWQTVSQAACTAIAAVDTSKAILVPNLAWYPPVSWPSDHPTPWISGVANPIYYEGHFYFDKGDGGFYSELYGDDLAWINAGYSFQDTFTAADVSPIPSGRLGDIDNGVGWNVSKFKIASNTAAPVDSTTCELYRDARYPYGTLRMTVSAWDTATASRAQWLNFRRTWNANFDGWRVGFDSTGVWKLQKSTAGSFASISGGNTVSTGTVVPSLGDVVTVDLPKGTADIVCKVNGAPLYSATDTYLQGATVVGVSCSAAPNYRVDAVEFQPSF